MVSVRRSPAGYVVRAHRMFAAALPRMVRTIARYVVHNDRRASEVIGQYIEQHQQVIRARRRAALPVKIRTAGLVHDLQGIFDRLNATHFVGRLEARITWGPAAARARRRRSIKMGSYSVEDRLIRIHPALDRPHVPDYFVAWIVFHEMLHGRHEVRRKDGRRCFHTPEFLQDERAFEEYERARTWEKANIERLLDG
jgi:predicted metal-dependent hydrolase